MGLLKTIIPILFFYNIAAAQVALIPVKVVTTTGNGALTHDDALTVFGGGALILYQQVGIRLGVQHIRRSRINLCSRYNDEAHYKYEARCLKGYLFRRNKDPNFIWFFITAPISVKNGQAIAGAASQVCGKKRVSFVAAQHRTEGLYGLMHSMIAAAHELGHSLGAEHTEQDPVTIMSPDPLPHADSACPINGCLKFSDESISQIWECIQR